MAKDIDHLSDFIIQFLKKEDSKMFLAPHNLNEKFIDRIKEKFHPNDVFEINDHCKIASSNSRKINILTYKGLLLETYSLFRIAYVGGGFGRSIHSVLEPYLSGCLVLCGPKVHRSTEYNLVSESNPYSIRSINNSTEFMNTLIEDIDFKEKKLSNNGIERIIGFYE